MFLISFQIGFKFKNKFKFGLLFLSFVCLQPILSINRHTLFWYNYIHVLSVYSKQMGQSLLYIIVKIHLSLKASKQNDDTLTRTCFQVSFNN